MPTYQDVLHQAEKEARKNHLEASAVKILLLHFSDLEPTELYLNMKTEMPVKTHEAFQKGMRQYIDDLLPVQYIIGYVYFYGYRFIVDHHVLIPRFETEELVANVLIEYDRVFNNQDVSVVDIGTGSGCLAIALKKEESHFSMVASDISEEALTVAKQNALALEADITFVQGDMLTPLQGMKFDILVSNPPYIPTTENVADIIHNNEPHVALFGGDDGLKFYDIILNNASSILNSKFIIAFEHGFDKADQLQRMARNVFPNANIFTLKDMQGKDRMTFVISE